MHIMLFVVKDLFLIVYLVTVMTIIMCTIVSLINRITIFVQLSALQARRASNGYLVMLLKRIEELDNLKMASITRHNIWKNTERSSSGIFMQLNAAARLNIN